jgi:predicted DNA-binding transcriptional regulator AlpA
MSKPPITIPPRGLNIKQAATYWGVSRGTFLKLVDLGIAPQPLDLGLKRNVYDREALDAAMTARAVASS